MVVQFLDCRNDERDIEVGLAFEELRCVQARARSPEDRCPLLVDAIGEDWQLQLVMDIPAVQKLFPVMQVEVHRSVEATPPRLWIDAAISFLYEARILPRTSRPQETTFERVIRNPCSPA